MQVFFQIPDFGTLFSISDCPTCETFESVIRIIEQLQTEVRKITFYITAWLSYFYIIQVLQT